MRRTTLYAIFAAINLMAAPALVRADDTDWQDALCENKQTGETTECCVTCHWLCWCT